MVQSSEQSVLMRCIRTVLDCSDENIPFYEKIGYSYHGNTMKIQHEQDGVPHESNPKSLIVLLLTNK
ncbi:MAG: hypothetical protein WBL67_15960 [Nitrososphaeraceae archaeon]